MNVLRLVALLAATAWATEPRFVVSGQVLDETGRPLERVTVAPVRMAPHCVGEGRIELGPPVSTSAGGQFELRGDDFVVFRGNALLLVTAGERQQTLTLSLSTHGPARFELAPCAAPARLVPAMHGRGELRLGRRPASGMGAVLVLRAATAAILTRLEPGRPSKLIASPADGGLAFDEVPPGRYLLELLTPSGPSEEGVEVAGRLVVR